MCLFVSHTEILDVCTTTIKFLGCVICPLRANICNEFCGKHTFIPCYSYLIYLSKLVWAMVISYICQNWFGNRETDKACTHAVLLEP